MKPLSSQKVIKFNYKIKSALLDVFNIRSAALLNFKRVNIFLETKYKSIFSLSPDVVGGAGLYFRRPAQIWGSGISKFSLIRNRRYFITYYNFFYLYQNKISRFLLTLYALVFEDLYIFSNFNVAKILKRSGLYYTPVLSAILEHRQVLFCNGINVCSLSFVCNSFDFLSFSPLFFLHLRVLSFKLEVLPVIELTKSNEKMLQSILTNKVNTAKTSWIWQKTLYNDLKLNPLNLFILEVDWRSFSFILLTIQLSLLQNIQNLSSILKLPSLNFRSLNWKYLT